MPQLRISIPHAVPLLKIEVPKYENCFSTPCDKSYKLLSRLAFDDQLNKIEKLIQDNPNYLNSRDSNGETLLFLAIKYGFDSLLSLLLDLGVDISVKNIQGITAKQYCQHLYHSKICTTTSIQLKKAYDNLVFEEELYEIGAEEIKTYTTLLHTDITRYEKNAGFNHDSLSRSICQKFNFFSTPARKHPTTSPKRILKKRKTTQRAAQIKTKKEP